MVTGLTVVATVVIVVVGGLVGMGTPIRYSMHMQELTMTQNDDKKMIMHKQKMRKRNDNTYSEIKIMQMLK